MPVTTWGFSRPLTIAPSSRRTFRPSRSLCCEAAPLVIREPEAPVILQFLEHSYLLLQELDLVSCSWLSHPVMANSNISTGVVGIAPVCEGSKSG